ncbi:hypothetical protein [Tepidibacter hydrothermalis]|uniref:Uncharacterized protein n=1 Tax=Tepidibacter hydrothermalis TaxID=3036126 RepID=A0ABY8E8V9_9FIRM|nr:hypothetical protein [Tepidibacter hydrothermalis]WFD09309.1 hypothetical protein P4S50_13045 [Tepidibacter hydrothermalis]
MAYNTIDLIDKAIDIAKKRKEIYINIANDNYENKRMNIVVNTLVKGLDKNIDCYNRLKKYIAQNEEVLENIDFLVYDKILFLVNQFKKRLMNPKISDIKSLLRFSLNLEKEIYALFIAIQGRLVVKEEDAKTNTYRFLSNIIKEKEEYIKNLEVFAKRQG